MKGFPESFQVKSGWVLKQGDVHESVLQVLQTKMFILHSAPVHLCSDDE